MITIDEVNKLRQQFESAKLAFLNSDSDAYSKLRSVELLISSYVLIVFETGECEGKIENAVIKAEVYSMMIESYFYIGIILMRSREYTRAIKILNDCILLISAGVVAGIENEILGIRARIALELAVLYLEHGDDMRIYSGVNGSCVKNRIIFHLIRNEINNLFRRAKHLEGQSDSEPLGLKDMMLEYEALERIIKLM